MARFCVALMAAAIVVFLMVNFQCDYLIYRLKSSHYSRLPQDWSGMVHDNLQDPFTPVHNETLYLLGSGKGDITGPVVEINLMGYADPKQLGTGLRQRLYSRAFIVGETDNRQNRIVYLILDTQSGDTAVRYGILEGLEKLGPEYSMYNRNNVAVTGTHSHSGPGAWLNYLLPQITSKGFDKQSYQAIVDGAILSIKRAHESLAPGYLTLAQTELLDANVNRSPFAYLANPLAERRRYADNVDKTMTLLHFRRASDGKSTAIITWFPVHGTSLYGNNTLISGDNKGLAATLFEKDVSASSGARDFVAGFSQSNVGDTSPNTKGDYCDDTGVRCTFEHSTCAGSAQQCHGRGPHFEVLDQGTTSCYAIGFRQYAAAKRAYATVLDDSIKSADATVRLVSRSPTVRSLHAYYSFSNYTFTLASGKVVRTCPAALGYSFAAGTTDGPGAFDFTQNATSPDAASPMWRVVRTFMHEPSEEQVECQRPKPVLMDVGNMKKPYLWSPNVVDVQLLRVGGLVIIVSPGEVTTMAGRRWKEAIGEAATRVFGSELHGETNDYTVVLGGPANTYTHYIATLEEYGVQRYEGASTLYGPYTLDAYVNLSVTMLPRLSSEAASVAQHGKHVPPLPPAANDPPIHTNVSLSFIRRPSVDRAPLFRTFGSILSDVRASYAHAQDVTVRFVGANPRNNLRLESSFVVIERQVNRGGAWIVVRDDSDWDVVFSWTRTNKMFGTSEVTITWEGKWAGLHAAMRQGGEGEGWTRRAGRHRICYFGSARVFLGGIVDFESCSSTFEIRED